MQRNRPLSPHLQVWRWHWTMAASIGHRVTGGAMYFGAFLLSAWVVLLASSPVETAAFAKLADIIASPFGQVVVLLWVFAALLHMLNGLRYLLWSGPKFGFSPSFASTLTLIIITVAGIGACAITFTAYY